MPDPKGDMKSLNAEGVTSILSARDAELLPKMPAGEGTPDGAWKAPTMKDPNDPRWEYQFNDDGSISILAAPPEYAARKGRKLTSGRAFDSILRVFNGESPLAPAEGAMREARLDTSLQNLAKDKPDPVTEAGLSEAVQFKPTDSLRAQDELRPKATPPRRKDSAPGASYEGE